MTLDELSQLPDDALCALFERGACDEEFLGHTVTTTCKFCGREFNHLRQGNRTPNVCPGCVADNKRERDRLHGKAMYQKKGPVYLRCVGTNLNYRRGQFYIKEVVEADIAQGLANREDFEEV
jgi:hypothetical protein